MEQKRPLIIAGPCSAESEEQILVTAKALAATGKVDIFRAGVWKPRTKPNTFEGMGEKALPWLVEARNATGLPIAIALGATVGKSEYMLEVLRDATPEAVAYAKDYMLRVPAQIHINYEAPSILYIHAEVRKGDLTAQATIMDEHTNFVPSPISNSSAGASDSHKVVSDSEASEPSNLNLRRVYDFAMEVDTNDITFLKEGAEMNTTAAETSFADQYGHGLGRLLRSTTLSATPEI